MKRIIVPTDFSDTAWQAFLYAAKLAEKFNAEITILNSFQAPQAIATDLISAEGILQEASENGLQKWLDKINLADLGKNLTIHSQSIEGDLVEALNTLVEEYDEHFIVMGSHGKTGILGKLMGSNATKVIDNVNCPVFVIPPNASSFSSRITFALDFDKVPEKVNLKLLTDLCISNQPNMLNVVHVVEDGTNEKVDQIALDSFLKDVPHETHLITGHNVSATLDKYATESNTELLVLIKRNKGLFESIFKQSVTKQLTLHASIPFLILKEST